MVTSAEHREQTMLAWSERVLQDHTVRMARSMGWLAYHTFDSRRSEPGYPDLHLVHPIRGLSLFRELKTTKGKTTEAQRRWLDGLTAVGMDAAVWRPADMVSGRIERELRGMKDGA